MTLLQLQVFIAVVEAGSFTKASMVLGMTQSAVSHIVISLETELEVTLLIRDRKGVKLTAAGERVFTHAISIQGHANKIKEEVLAEKEIELGEIRVGSFPSISAEVLPKLISAFHNKYPGIKVIPLDGTNQEVRNWIYTGAVQTGFISLPDVEFESVPMFTDEMIAVLPEQHALARNAAITVQQLAGEPFIITKGGCEGMIRSIFYPLRPDIRLEAKETSTILKMVEQGLGVTVLPRLAIGPKVTKLSILPLEPAAYRQLGLAVPAMASIPAAVQIFLNFAEQWFQIETIDKTSQ